MKRTFAGQKTREPTLSYMLYLKFSSKLRRWANKGGEGGGGGGSKLGILTERTSWMSPNISRERPTVRSNRSQIFYKIGIFKESAKFTRKKTLLESLLMKVVRYKETPAQVFSWECCKTLKNTFFAEYLR